MKNKLDNLKYCNDAIALKTAIERSFVSLGEYLHTIREQQLYVPQWSSWDEFYSELKMSQNAVNKLIQIYETFVLKYSISADRITDAGGWSVIAECLPVIDTKADAEEWLHKAAALTRDDLRKEVKEKRTGVSEQHCPTNHKNTYLIRICRDCGMRSEEHEHA